MQDFAKYVANTGKNTYLCILKENNLILSYGY